VLDRYGKRQVCRAVGLCGNSRWRLDEWRLIPVGCPRTVTQCSQIDAYSSLSIGRLPACLPGLAVIHIHTSRQLQQCQRHANELSSVASIMHNSGDLMSPPGVVSPYFATLMNNRSQWIFSGIRPSWVSANRGACSDGRSAPPAKRDGWEEWLWKGAETSFRRVLYDRQRGRRSCGPFFCIERLVCCKTRANKDGNCRASDVERIVGGCVLSRWISGNHTPVVIVGPMATTAPTLTVRRATADEVREMLPRCFATSRRRCGTRRRQLQQPWRPSRPDSRRYRPRDVRGRTSTSAAPSSSIRSASIWRGRCLAMSSTTICSSSSRSGSVSWRWRDTGRSKVNRKCPRRQRRRRCSSRLRRPCQKRDTTECVRRWTAQTPPQSVVWRVNWRDLRRIWWAAAGRWLRRRRRCPDHDAVQTPRARWRATRRRSTSSLVPLPCLPRRCYRRSASPRRRRQRRRRAAERGIAPTTAESDARWTRSWSGRKGSDANWLRYFTTLYPYTAFCRL